MGAADRVPATIAGTWHGRLLDSLYELYDELDRAIEAFQRASRLGCPEGCGTCCARYEPTVLPAEGMAVAAWIARTGVASKAILAPDADEGVGCVFGDPTRPLHCTVYPARPLECRLFAFSGVRGKDGEPRFRLCRHMEGPRGTLTGAALTAALGAPPPLMPDYAARLQALGASESAPLRRQARSAWQALRNLLDLQQAGAR